MDGLDWNGMVMVMVRGRGGDGVGGVGDGILMHLIHMGHAFIQWHHATNSIGSCS